MTVNDEPTILWRLRRDDQEVSCQARLVPYGIEVDIARGGAVVLTRVFETDDEALAWACEKRAAREAQGWRALPPDSPPVNVRVV
ncbi:MAG: hypothetical protein GEU82_18690 [Luteitalea sp.]|nr:hypothetical protein [Luteitalea sp.]